MNEGSISKKNIESYIEYIEKLLETVRENRRELIRLQKLKTRQYL